MKSNIVGILNIESAPKSSICWFSIVFCPNH